MYIARLLCPMAREDVASTGAPSVESEAQQVVDVSRPWTLQRGRCATGDSHTAPAEPPP